MNHLFQFIGTINMSKRLTPSYYIVHDYTDANNQEDVEMELEKALAMQVKHIIIEPYRLGNETASWIKMGNFLHKASVVSGVISLSTGYFQKDLFSFPLAAASFLTAGVYAVSWASDPCCKYQLETNIGRIQGLSLQDMTSASKVMLVRRDDSRRKYLQNIVSISAILLCAYKVYSVYYS